MLTNGNQLKVCDSRIHYDLGLCDWQDVVQLQQVKDCNNIVDSVQITIGGTLRSVLALNCKDAQDDSPLVYLYSADADGNIKDAKIPTSATSYILRTFEKSAA